MKYFKGKSWLEVYEAVKTLITEKIEARGEWHDALILLENLPQDLSNSIAHKMLEEEDWKLLGSIYLCRNSIDEFALSKILPIMDSYKLSDTICLQYFPSNFAYVKIMENLPNAALYFQNLIQNDFESVKPSSWIAIAYRFLDAKKYKISKQIVSILYNNVDYFNQLSLEECRQVTWMYNFFFSNADPVALAPEDKNPVTLGILAYKSPTVQMTSANAGDATQTLALLSNIARFDDFEFSGSPRLVSFMKELKSRIQAENKISTTSKTINIEEINRDAPSFKKYNNKIWLIVYGWFAHALYRHSYDFPFPENIRPIFISFNLSERDLLTPDAIDYLKKYEPIGCRDLSTVLLLREYGIKAFFSGCLTTTMDNIFNKEEVLPKKNSVAFVDYVDYINEFKNEIVQKISQRKVSEIAVGDLVENLRYSLTTFEALRSYKKIITNRLHTYLPCKALNLDVQIRHEHLYTDNRFDGLVPISNDRLKIMSDDLKYKLEKVIGWIGEDLPDHLLYQKWAELCQSDLEKTEEYFANLPNIFTINKQIINEDKIINNIVHYGAPDESTAENVNISFALDTNLTSYLPIVIQSIVSTTKRKLSFNILTRGIDSAWFEKVYTLFNYHDFTFIPCDSLKFGSFNQHKGVTVSTLDRLILPNVNTSNKTIYLDLDTLVLGDLSELYNIDITNYYLGAARTLNPEWNPCYKLIDRMLKNTASKNSFSIKHQIYQLGRMDNAFHAGVLLLNLERMRSDDLPAKTISMVTNWKCNDQDALNIIARNDYLEIDPKWNYFYVQRHDDSPKIIHWAGPHKPWHDFYLPWQSNWKEVEKIIDIKCKLNNLSINKQ